MKEFLLTTFKIVTVLYILTCLLLFFFQESLIFAPQKLDKDFKFNFKQPFEEKNIHTEDGTILNGILFKTNQAKGVIFYLHGNAGTVNSWGEAAGRYTDLNYDIFMLDYRGYGKSGGSINSQAQMFKDVQSAYNELKKLYAEDKIIVLGYSIGTGPAAKLASTNNPKLLILEAPYYSLIDMMKYTYPIIPTFILKYKFETNEYLKLCKMPVVIFHGDADEVIYYGSSIKLKENFKQHDTLITLTGQMHNGITDNKTYISEIEQILGR